MIITTLASPDANSYASLTAANAYHDARNNLSWLASQPEAQAAALIRATDYIDATYVFRSIPSVDEQALENPRYGEAVLDARLVKATCLLALDMLESEQSAAEQPEITQESKTLEGVGSKSVTYGKRPSDPFPIVTKMLARIATPRSSKVGVITMVRP